MKRTRPAKDVRQSTPAKAPRNASPAASRRELWIWAGLLVLLVLLVYAPTLANGFIWDDDDYVMNNRTLRSLGGLRDIWFKLGAVPQYYPLVHSTFWCEYHLWGLDPRGYHLANLALHATAAVLVWRLLVRLQVPGAWFAAALFAVHPVEVESVAWITERKNVLSCVLALGSLLAYLRFWPADEAAMTNPARAERPEQGFGEWWWYALALALYVGALFSKTITASVPAVLLVVYWWKRGRLTWRDVAPLAPFFVIGLSLALVTATMEKSHVGASGEDWNFSPADRVLIAGRALWFYAGKLAWPYPLIFFYTRWDIDDHQPWQYLFPAAALAVVVGLWLARERIGRGPLAAVLIFAGVLAPALGFFDVFPFRYSFVADHFQYHASIAMLALAAAACTLTVWRLSRESSPMARANAWRFAGQTLGPPQWLAALVLAALGVVACLRTSVYKDLVTLWTDTIARNPECWAAYNNLGNYWGEHAEYRKAVDNLSESVRLAPERSLTRGNLAAALIRLGRYDEALAQVQTVLAKDPQDRLALCNFGVALAAKGDLPAGIEKVREAIRYDYEHKFDVAYNELGSMLSALGHTSEAVGPYETAVELQPDNTKYRVDAATALIKLGQFPRAEQHLKHALAVSAQNADAHHRLGIVCQAQGDTRSAIGHFQAALASQPGHPGAAAAMSQIQTTK